MIAHIIILQIQSYIVLQATTLQDATTGAQQGVIQHHADIANDTQQRSSVHQPTPLYALPNKQTANNKDQEASSYLCN